MIITLGEVVLGTILAISAVVESPEGWSLEAVLIALGGTTLVFALWWSYFMMPSGPMLARHQGRAWVWGYGHILALRLADRGRRRTARRRRRSSRTKRTSTPPSPLTCVAIPVLAFEVMLFVLYTLLVREFDPFHIWLFVGAVAVLAVAVAAVSAASRSAGRSSSSRPLRSSSSSATRRSAGGTRPRCSSAKESEGSRHPLVCYRDRMSANFTSWWPTR